MDIQGIEPWTSRMRSVRATTVPNAHTIATPCTLIATKTFHNYDCIYSLRKLS